MAYLIFNGNDLYKIASSDEKVHMNIEDVYYNVKTVSDSDFDNVRKNKKSAKLSGDSVVYEDIVTLFINEESLQKHINEIVAQLEIFLESNPDNPMYSGLETYKNVLLSQDLSSITYPLNKTWEEYCVENSITYYSPLQIP
jgi:hypothetical protein